MHYSPSDEIYMQRCLDLAVRAGGRTAPNPMVGCVIVRQGQIIGEGYHHMYGDPHAEVCAVAAVTDRAALSGATVYVSLEPCAHYGKTPPCADMLASLPIRRVVVGSFDPNPKVSGRGIAKLRAAGLGQQPRGQLAVERALLAQLGLQLGVFGTQFPVFGLGVHRRP